MKNLFLKLEILFKQRWKKKTQKSKQKIQNLKQPKSTSSNDDTDKS